MEGGKEATHFGMNPKYYKSTNSVNINTVWEQDASRSKGSSTGELILSDLVACANSGRARAWFGSWGNEFSVSMSTMTTPALDDDDIISRFRLKSIRLLYRSNNSNSRSNSIDFYTPYHTIPYHTIIILLLL